MRVYELAKKLGVENKQALEALSELGLDVGSVHASVSDEDAERLAAALGKAAESKPAKAAKKATEKKVTKKAATKKVATKKAETKKAAEKKPAEKKPATKKVAKKAPAAKAAQPAAETAARPAPKQPPAQPKAAERKAEKPKPEKPAEKLKPEKPEPAPAAKKPEAAPPPAKKPEKAPEPPPEPAAPTLDPTAEPLAIEDGITVRELADELDIKAADVLRVLMAQGVMANINASLEADVAVSIVESHDPGAVGAQMTYTATVGNFGPERAVDALLSVPLSIAVSPVSAVPSQGSCTIVGRNVTCALGDVRFGETATVILTVTPLHSGAVAVHADVAAANQDVFPENNHGCEMTSVLGAATIKTADLRVEVEDSADPIQVGQLLTYTVTVTHDGGVPVTSALASLELPFGMFLQSVSPSQGSCSGDRIIICNTGSMAAGQQMTVSVTVWVLRGGALEASAIVSSGVTDPQVGDNSFDEITQAEDPPA